MGIITKILKDIPLTLPQERDFRFASTFKGGIENIKL
jgi:hypothetical protein